MSGQHRFRKQQRLLLPAQYRYVFDQQSCRSVDDCFTFIAAPNKVGSSRIGLAIAKKQLRRAVDRNHCKRLIRESFRQHNEGMPPLDIVVLARSNFLRTDKAKLHDKLARHWRQLAKRATAKTASKPSP